jgi:hypothetical protein
VAARAGVGLEPFSRARDRPRVVPAEGRAQDRREHPQQRLVGVHAPVEAHVRAAVGQVGQRPAPGAAEVAVDLALDHLRRLEPDDPRARVQVVGQPALEVLARLLAELGLALGVDVDVDRPPPPRVGAGVGDRVEHRLARGGDVPRVDEQVLARGDGEDRLRQRALDPLRRLGRAAAVAEVARELGERRRRGPAEAVDVHLGQAAQERLGVAGRAQLHAHAPRLVAELAVRRVARDGHGLAGLQHVLAAVDHEPHRALDHLVALLLLRVEMSLPEEAAGAPDDVELDQLVGVLADLDDDAQPGHLECGHGAYALTTPDRISGSAPRSVGVPGGPARACTSSTSRAASSSPGPAPRARRWRPAGSPPTGRCRTAGARRSCPR